MPRRSLTALLAVSSVALLACRPDTVQLGFDPDAGATYRYRYEVDATITRQIEDGEPQTTEVHLTFDSEQTVLEATEGGARMEVTLTSRGSAPKTAEVTVDRAGSLQAIQAVDGLPADALGLPAVADLLAAAATEPPRRALALGDAWATTEGLVTGKGRLDHYAVLDGEDSAVVESTVVEVLTQTSERSGSEVVLDGDLRSSATTAFDLADGSVRRSRTRSHGTVDVLVAPPVDVVAPPVDATVTYDLRVTTTRLG